MRKYGKNNGIGFKVFAGTTGVLMAFDIEDGLKPDFLGFAIHRKKESGPWKWVQGFLQFEQVDHYVPIDSNLAPIQKFRWSDYAVYPKTHYRYKVYAVHGAPGHLTYTEGPELAVRTESIDTGTHQVVFNRAVAASQAYSRRFHNTNPDDESDPNHQAARAWLARGMIRKIERFIERAKDNRYALEVAIYEFELEQYADALLAAHQRGAEVKVIFHAKKNDEQTRVNQAFLAQLPAALIHPRVTTAIFHQKFIVLKKKNKKGEMRPTYLLTGTANFTPNGLWRQANVIHVVRSAALGRQYSALFAQLLSSKGRGDTKRYINTHYRPISSATKSSSFSPRSGYDDIDFIADIIKNAQSEVFVCSAFSLHPKVTEALANPTGENIHYGLQNNRTRITGLHRNLSFTVPTYLRSGLEGFLKESTKGQRGSIFIHLKTLIVDFATEDPVVVVGSHNFSRPASDKNDENFLIIRGNTDVADTYFCEMMRLYDHYRFRYNRKKAAVSPAKSLTLANDNRWLRPYFDPSHLKFKERVHFCRPV